MIGSITALSKSWADVSRRLQQLFREQFDCSPMQHVRRQRLEHARVRLEHPDSADFRRQFACLPSELLRIGRAQG